MPLRRSLCVFAVAATVASPACAKDVRRVLVQNTSGRDAAAVTLTFSEQSGRVVVTTPSVFPDRGSCGLPKIEVTKSVARLTWGNACVQPDAVILMLAVSQKNPLTFANGAWIGAAGDTLALIAAADVQVTTPETITQYPRSLVLALVGFLLLDVLLIWLVIRQRRSPSANPA